jgi:pimeloyl-ACP methyl ester carboxylesterase
MRCVRERLVAMFVSVLLSCGVQVRAGDKALAESCRTLVHVSIPVSRISLPTRGASIASAELESPEGGRMVCVVKGAIAPLDPKAPVINFQINMPLKWNGRAVHEGGGGYDGGLVDGRFFLYLPGVAPITRLALPFPVVDIVPQRYVTFGSDSGHQSDGTIATMAAFAANEEALENFGGAQLKKVHDVAIQVIKQYYGRVPRRMYFYGSSQGGHEALTVAQRWPADYDGVISIHPAYDFTALQLGGLHVSQSIYHPEAWISPAKAKLIANAVLKTCDSLDGLADGVIANVAACRTAFDLRSISCPSGDDKGDDCLSAMQIEAAESIARDTTFDFSVSGVSSFGGWPILEGAGAAEVSAVGFGAKPVPDRPPTQADSGLFVLSDQLVRYMAMRDPAYDSLAFKPTEHIAALQRISNIIDASSADLDAFRRHGGKLLLMHGTVDMAIPPSNTIAYYERLNSRYGAQLKDFVRFYMAPGFGHATGPFFVRWNSLATLERWVETGISPGQQIAEDTVPEHGGRSRPLCEYPKWPKYRGSGNPDVAGSFLCTSD